MTDTDIQLLERYSRHGAEEAFAELVRRHLNLVYSAAFRQVRSPQLAEEVVFATFQKLAREAPRLAPGSVVSAWLYQTARHHALDAIRKEARQRLRDQVAHDLTTMNADTADWTEIAPLLDDAMQALGEIDRTAVLLRFFENQSFREVGQALGTGEDAAQKRVSRAVERLRDWFGQHGVKVGVGGLGSAIAANSIQAAPAGMAVAVTGSSLTSATIATGSLTIVKITTLTMLQKTSAILVLAIILCCFMAWPRWRSAPASEKKRISLSAPMPSTRLPNGRSDANLPSDGEGDSNVVPVAADPQAELNMMITDMARLLASGDYATMVSKYVQPEAKAQMPDMAQQMAQDPQWQQRIREVLLPALQSIDSGTFTSSYNANLDQVSYHQTVLGPTGQPIPVISFKRLNGQWYW